MSTINARNAQDAANPVHLSFSEKRQPLLQGDAHHYLMARGDQLAFSAEVVRFGFSPSVLCARHRARTRQALADFAGAAVHRHRQKYSSPGQHDVPRRPGTRMGRRVPARSHCREIRATVGRSSRNDLVVRAAGPAGQSPLMLAALTIGVQRANSSLICVAKRSGVPPAASMPKAANRSRVSGKLKNAHRLAVQLADNRRGRPCWRQQPEPRVEFQSRITLFGDGGNVRECRDPGLAGYRKGRELSAFQVGFFPLQIVEGDRHFAGEQILERAARCRKGCAGARRLRVAKAFAQPGLPASRHPSLST